MIRVFAVSRPIADMAEQLRHNTKAEVATALLGLSVSENHIELFALSDLTGVGLPRYLMDGYDVDPGAISGLRARLEALDGYILLLFSSVSDAGDVAFAPAPDLTLIGTFAEPRAQHVAPPLDTQAAKPYSGVTAPPAPMARARAGSAMVAVFVIVLLTLIWWIFA
jgi:hypothetical protein